jgi:hypothetical protein
MESRQEAVERVAVRREGGCRTTAARMRTMQGPTGSVSQQAARSQEGLRGEQHRDVEDGATTMGCRGQRWRCGSGVTGWE